VGLNDIRPTVIKPSFPAVHIGNDFFNPEEILFTKIGARLQKHEAYPSVSRAGIRDEKKVLAGNAIGPLPPKAIEAAEGAVSGKRPQFPSPESMSHDE
jgi:hypothetical protein